VKPLGPGSRLGDYVIEAVLGRGGMGVVYRARHAELGRQVALKVLAPEVAGDAEFLERFRREARLAASVDHPNVTKVHHAGVEQGIPYIVFELVPGGVLYSKAPLPWRDALVVVGQLASGLAALHAAGIIHRDFKPTNVLLDEEGRPKISDFGLARDTQAAFKLTTASVVLGTPQFMAPEQFTRSKDVDARADVYALGATLFFLLTGKPPFEGDHPALMKAAHEQKPRATSEVVPGVPRSVDRLVFDLLAKQPSARPPTANAVGRRIEAVLEGRDHPPRRLLPLAVVAALFVVAVSLALAFGVHQEPPPVPSPPPAPKPAPPPPPPAHKQTPQGRPSSLRADPKAPAWFLVLSPDRRPPLPLPEGVTFGQQPGEYVAEKDGSIFVFVPEGSFLMGSEHGEGNERPVHEVELSAYFIGKYELTNDRFEKFVKETRHLTTAERDKVGTVLTGRDEKSVEDIAGASWRFPRGRAAKPMDGDRPAVQVTWDDAMAYCAWAHVVLPTEAQWEKAACWDPTNRRARTYPWGDSLPTSAKKLANVADDSLRARWPRYPAFFEGYDDGYEGTAPVSSGIFYEGQSPVSAYDMAGNVMEWCRDRYDEAIYSLGPKRDPVSTGVESDDSRVVRGWGWNATPALARCAWRAGWSRTKRNDALGFRVALELSPAARSRAPGSR
jgi:serine/threonine protein kinase